MGLLQSCCKRPPDATADPRAALRAGGRIRVARNETEDPRAPLLTKRRDERAKPLKPDPDLAAFADILSGTDDPDESEQGAFVLPAKRD
jgi:hypothetical protein